MMKSLYQLTAKREPTMQPNTDKTKPVKLLKVIHFCTTEISVLKFQFTYTNNTTHPQYFFILFLGQEVVMLLLDKRFKLKSINT